MRTFKLSLGYFLFGAALIALSACDDQKPNTDINTDKTVSTGSTLSNGINPTVWPTIKKKPLDKSVEAEIDNILSKMTLEQKVGQVIQADSNSVTAEEVKNYRLGSVLSGGNSAPGEKQYADTASWLEAADQYYLASIDPEGVDIAIPIIWGIDAVHGHTNLLGGTVFPHNIGLGAANDPELIKRISEATARELSVSGHDWTFAPTLAVPQNDRWGRAYEGFSENPDIVKSYGGAIVEGLQGVRNSDEFMTKGRVISSAKHFLADGGTENGVDQGDSKISQEELRDIHLAGYMTAVDAGAQSVMASFSSWQGQPMHGQKELLTDVLKGRMNFDGFVIGDWNGHALIPGCTTTDCPQSLNAGLDMYMAPDSWKGLYESTLEHVQSGVIPMERLDDAVRRILRVKINSGIFDKPKPSARPLSGKVDILGSAEHRALAREAVRKSQVLLKNNDQTLPLSPGMNVHIIGKAAGNISKMSGGWTLSWQGGNHGNDEFPNGETLVSAIKKIVEPAGGSVTYDMEATRFVKEADVIIAVYGEDPYAEFRGDRDNVDFSPNDLNPEYLEKYNQADIPVVSVFVSGRPLWTNPELNVSDAFIAAWLPGSEAGGIADLLFQTKPEYDFTGRLSFSWPRLATQDILNPHHKDYDPLFPLGYGLSLSDNKTVDQLNEESGLENDAAGKKGVFFKAGITPQPWRFMLNGTNIDLPYSDNGVSVSGYDHLAQEDAVMLKLSDQNDVFSIASRYAHNFERETNGAMELSFKIKSLGEPVELQYGLGCPETGTCNSLRNTNISSDWSEIRTSLKCFSSQGADMQLVKKAFSVKGATSSIDVAIAEIELVEESAEGIRCDG